MMIIEPCEKCIPDSYDKVYDNIVTTCYAKDQNLFKLLLYTSLSAIDTEQRFMPVPLYCKSGKYENDKLCVAQVNRDFMYYMDKIKLCDTDLELSKHLKTTEYMFLKHVIKSNNTSLNYFDNTNEQIRCDDVWTNGNSILFTIDHPIQKQKRFDAAANVVHLFHGSGTHNWYSIMRNGLKNYSGTALMSCGQVHGPGIYLGGTMDISYAYCSKNNEVKQQQLHQQFDDISIMGCN
jgi:hypothetical protein